MKTELELAREEFTRTLKVYGEKSKEHLEAKAKYFAIIEVYMN